MASFSDQAPAGFADRAAAAVAILAGKKSGGEARPKESVRVVKQPKAIQILDFLDNVGLDETPENYNFGWEYYFGSQLTFRQTVDKVISKERTLSNGRAKEVMAEYFSLMSAETLSELISNGDKILHEGGQAIRQSHHDTKAYSSALQEKVEEIEVKPDSGAVHFTALIELTKTMAKQAYNTQELLQKKSESLVEMRNQLNEATNRAETDQLTGLPNRWAFEKHLTEAVKYSRENIEPLSVAIVDVDDFKAVNDTHGHDTGDRVLRRIAESLNNLSDAHCHVARHGGEEFVILFKGQTTDEAFEKLDRARLSLCEHDFVNRENSEKIGKVSYSGGISELNGDGDARTMLRRADRALYDAKEAGKNRIHINNVEQEEEPL